jgi:monoterpene epsilon-lactone hydrolase
MKFRGQLAAVSMLFSPLLMAQQATGATAPESFTHIDAQGTVYITRIVPVPETISPEAQKSLVPEAAERKDPNATEHLQVQRQTSLEIYRAQYPVEISSSTIAGIPVHIVTPLQIPAAKADRVLINLHGGGFTKDSGSLIESVPVANLTQTKVVSVLYRLAPEHPFPAAVEDTVTVYKELLKTYKPEKIGIYGSSAGAVLTPEVAVQLKMSGIPLPGALGVFSGGGDFTKTGDSQFIYGVGGLNGAPDTRPNGVQWIGVYVGSADPKNPVLSPYFADLHGLPATLFMTSTRDMLLSDTTLLHRAFLRAGVDAQLVVFEGLNHCFWYNPSLPESREADEIMANFFNKALGGR